jgi:5-methylcytosine-specific restriction endonuclease McrA
MKSNRTKATDIPMSVKQKVWERDNHHCINCGSPYSMPNAHYISRAHGGLGIEENIVTLCLDCHHNYDNGKSKELKEHIKEKIERYLKSIYPNWDKDSLIYKKRY